MLQGIYHRSFKRDCGREPVDLDKTVASAGFMLVDMVLKLEQ